MHPLRCGVAKFAVVARHELVLSLCLVRAIVQWAGPPLGLGVLGPAFGQDVQSRLLGRRNMGFRGRHVTDNLPLYIPLDVLVRSFGFECTQRVHRAFRQRLHLFRSGTPARARVLDTAGEVEPELSSVVANRVDVDRVVSSLTMRCGFVRYVEIDRAQRHVGPETKGLWWVHAHRLAAQRPNTRGRESRRACM